jgi:PAS domain S-box-containing protein
MPKDTPESIQKTVLRQNAEKLHFERPKTEQSRDPASLVHELEVHQIELEMQNEEIQRSQFEAEAARDKYLDLYDFAPVGYLTLNEKGVISELNLTAARLLGVERKSLVGKSFHHFIKLEFQDVFYFHIQKVLESSGTKVCELVLKKNDGTLLNVDLDSIEITVNGRGQIRTILTDITERKRAEEEREKLVLELKEALAQIKTLHGILNICSYCHKIRNDEGKWEQMELYIRNRSEADFSHGLCPECSAIQLSKYHLRIDE